jgi:hypothetical protein
MTGMYENPNIPEGFLMDLSLLEDSLEKQILKIRRLNKQRAKRLPNFFTEENTRREIEELRMNFEHKKTLLAICWRASLWNQLPDEEKFN